MKIRNNAPRVIILSVLTGNPEAPNEMGDLQINPSEEVEISGAVFGVRHNAIHSISGDLLPTSADEAARGYAELKASPVWSRFSAAPWASKLAAAWMIGEVTPEPTVTPGKVPPAALTEPVEIAAPGASAEGEAASKGRQRAAKGNASGAEG